MSIMTYLFFSTVVFIESTQLFLALVRVLNLGYPTLNESYFLTEASTRVHGHGQVICFALFIGLSIGANVCATLIFKRRLSDRGFINRLKSFAIIETILLFLLLSCAFKIFVYPQRPTWPHYAFDGLLIMAAFNKLLWPRVKDLGRISYVFLMDEANVLALRTMADVAFPVFILLFLYVPDYQAAVARIFIGEQFHHTESFLMGPAYAFSTGSVLHIDNCSMYGFGLPILVSYITKLCGGLSYESSFLLLMWTCIAYYLMWYWLLRKVFNSVPVAILGLLLGLKLQFFNTGGYPLMLTYPNGTPIRYWFDGIYFALLFYHLKTHRSLFLWLAGACAGFAIFYMTDTGVYMTMSLGAYILLHVIIPDFRTYIFKSKRELWKVAGHFLIAPCLALFLFWLFLQQHLFSVEFAANLSDFSRRYLNCFATESMFQRIQEKQFQFSLIGFCYPLIYMTCVLWTTSFLYLRKLEYRHVWVVVLAIYGLCTYQYHVVVSSSYYAAGLPCIFVIFYWINYALGFAARALKKKIILILASLIIYATATNHMVLMYPNIFNISHNPYIDRLVLGMNGNIKYFNQCFIHYPDAFKLPKNSLGESFEDWRLEDDFTSDEELKAYYHREFHFPEDVKLIQDLTPPNAKVPLLSSFEIKFLMEAKRRPFFYFFPLINSRPLRARIFVTTLMYTSGHLQNTIDRLERAQAPLVFMERIFLTRDIPQAYYYDSQDFLSLMQYIYAHYEPYAYGKYLVAMKRKPS